VRPPTHDDAERVAAMLSAHAPEPVEPEIVLREWTSPAVDLVRDVRIADDAYAGVDGQDERAFIRFAGSPDDALVAWAEARARERGATRIITGYWHGEDDVAAALARARYEPAARKSVRMRIELDGRSFAPVWPDGIRVRAFREGDERAVYETNIETFADLSEPMAASFEEWSHWLLEPPLFSPELYFVAEADDGIAGIALCHDRDDVGLIGIVGVRTAWRGRGLGRALVEHAFAELAARDFRAAILGAERPSPTGADRLYERVGMRVTHTRERLEKRL
jgi:ribosomal protein S18 acetylase RimI-like enzyme